MKKLQEDQYNDLMDISKKKINYKLYLFLISLGLIIVYIIFQKSINKYIINKLTQSLLPKEDNSIRKIIKLIYEKIYFPHKVIMNFFLSCIIGFLIYYMIMFLL